MSAAPRMRFFLDEGVPHAVGRLLEANGHEVLYLEDRIAKGSKDDLVAAIAEANDAVLVAFDSDFKSIASRIGIGRTKFKRLSLLRFEKCREAKAAERLESALSLLYHEWELAQRSKDRRLFVVVQSQTIRTHR